MGGNGEILGETAGMGEAEFDVGSLADVGEAYTAVAAFSTVDEAFGDNFLAGGEVLDVRAYGFYGAAPGMPGTMG